jgi:hypothetical protein
MTRRKAFNVRAGPDPKRQREEREARIAAILAGLRHHRVHADIQQHRAGQYHAHSGPGHTQAGDTTENNVASNTDTVDENDRRGLQLC